MNWLDYLLIAIVGLSAAISLIRGFVREAISLAGLVAAFFVASHFSPVAADWYAAWLPSAVLRELAGFATLFVLVTMAAGLVGWLAGKLVDAAHLTATDRMLGLFFGAARGLLLIGLAFLIYTSLAGRPGPWIAESKLAPYAIRLGEWIGGLIPKGYPFSRQGMKADIPLVDRARLEKLLEKESRR